MMMKTTMRREKARNVPTYLRRRIKRKNIGVNDDEDYYEKKKHATCPPT